MRRLHILVDLDGVLADFEGWRHKVLTAAGHPALPPDQVTDFYGTKSYTAAFGAEAAAQARIVVSRRGFFRHMPPISGGVEAVRAWAARGHTVQICSKPLDSNPACTLEKEAWIKEHLGEDWLRSSLIVKKKSLFAADFLVDDRPNLVQYTLARGEPFPRWKHILFRQPWNADSTEHYDHMNNWQDNRWLAAAEAEETP